MRRPHPRRRSKQRGQVLIVVIFGLLGLIAATGLVIDGGRAYSKSRQMDAAAEAAAHAGAFKLQKAWDGASFGALTDFDVQTVAKTYAAYNGWGDPANYNGSFSGNQAGGQFFLTYINADGTTTNPNLTSSARGVSVQLSMPQEPTFTKVVGIGTYDIFARATAMFGSAVSVPALPLVVNDDAFTPASYCLPPAPCNPAGFQPGQSSFSYGTFNFASIVPPGCVAGDIDCYLRAMEFGSASPIKVAQSYPGNSFDAAALSTYSAQALQARIRKRPNETCSNFSTPSPRVVFLPVANGDIGGSSVYLIRFRAVFLTEVVPPSGFKGCFVRTSASSGDFDPNAVGTGYGGVTIMKLVRPPGTVTPTTVRVVSITSPNRAGVLNGATVTASTTTQAFCTIVVSDPTPSNARGLGAAYADATGKVSWTWTVDAAAPPGSWPVNISCAYQALVGRTSTSLVVI